MWPVCEAGPDEDLLERALGQFVVQRLGPGMPADAGLFKDLFSLLIGFGLSFPPAVGGVFRALITLDGTLNRLAPGFNLVEEATSEASRWVGGALVPDSVSEALLSEGLSLLPVLRRLPRRIDRIAGAAERGEFAVNVRLFSDERDARALNRIVNRSLLVVIAAAVGFISTLLLDMRAGPILTESVGLMEALGYLGLGISAVLFLRAFVAIMRTDK
jgi:ubiquinone biosynthesis protein